MVPGEDREREPCCKSPKSLGHSTAPASALPWALQQQLLLKLRAGLHGNPYKSLGVS